MRKKAKRKSPPKSKPGKAATAPPEKPKTQSPPTPKDKEELIRIWDEDLCE